VTRIGGSQGNISGHLACLKECGMVTDRPQGRAVWYSIAEPDVIAVIRAAEDLLARTGIQVDLCPNYQATGRPRP
jgi:DNA-binding transcriptional ArsR family regulator